MGVLDIEPTVRLLDLAADRSALAQEVRSSPENALAKMFAGFEIPRERASACLAAAQGARSRAAGLSANERRLVAELRELRTNAKQVRWLLEDLTQRESEVIAAAEGLAREYLPARASFEGARVVLVPMGRDAKVSGRAVYLDPLLVLDLGPALAVRVLGHELHHVARGRLARDGFTGFDADVGSSFGEVLGLFLVLTEMEGVADRIAEITLLEPSLFPEARQARQAVFDGYATHLEKIQTAVREGLSGAATRDAAAVRIREVATELCHPIGFRMATEIETALGRSRLRACVAHPVAFLDAYQEAAAARGLFAFDDAVLAGIKEHGAPRGRARVR